MAEWLDGYGEGEGYWLGYGDGCENMCECEGMGSVSGYGGYDHGEE